MKPGSSLPDSLLSEENKLHNWFRVLGSILNSNMSDARFRGTLSSEGPDSIWNTRPLILKKLDAIPQLWPHTQTVGLHTYNVCMKLNTTGIKNTTDIDRVKVVRAAALFHDNGKKNDPTNDRHPFDSAQEVDHYLKWMDFNEKEIKLCLHLIAHHDVLGKTVNPQAKETVDDVVKICQTPEVIDCLLALTVADIKSIEGLIEIPHIIENINIISNIAKTKAQKRNQGRSYFLPK